MYLFQRFGKAPPLFDLQPLEKRCLLSAVAGAVYPSPLNTATQQLEVSPNGRSLIRADGTPFFYLADTTWELFNRPTLAQADTYLQNRAAKGFTVIQANLLDNRVGDPQPIVNNDPTQINAAYFTNVDNILSEAQSLGLYVAIVPVWSSLVDVSNSVFNASNAFTYGQYLGNRYKNSNVIWLLGGDSPNTNTAVWSALANGLIAGDGGTELMSFHPVGGDSSSMWYQNDSRLNFNMLQSGHNSATANYSMITNDYNLTPIKPVVDGESAYENIPDGLENWNGPITDTTVRLKTYWGIFAGGMGAAYGEMDVYAFWTPAYTPDFPNNPNTGVVNVTWQNVLDTPGAVEMKYVAALMESRPLLNRIPDQSMLASSSLSGNNYIEATRDSGGAYGMIYSSSGQSFTVNMTKISGSTATAWWYNPRTGAATKIGNYATTGTQQFVPPSNGSGNDWVLVLDDASKGYAAPGLPPGTITVGPASQLAFAMQPSNATTGATLSPAVTVDVEDTSGNLVTTDNSSVTLSVATGPASLGGTIVAQASAGVATFSNLTLATAGTYTLAAVDASLTHATSGSFTLSTPVTGLPAPWQAVSVGSVGVTGSATYNNGIFTVNGSGNDIYGTVDAFEGVFQTLSGDGSIIARVTGLPTTGSYAKTGVMIRATTAANSQQASMLLTPSGAFFENRAIPGGSTGYNTASGKPPLWLKVVRAGNLFSGYVSSNGTSWSLVGSATIAMGASVQMGLVTTSWDNKLLGTGTLDSVSVATGVALPASKLAFGQQPGSATVGLPISPAVTVDVEDSGGNIVTTDNSNITLSLASGPGTLGGTVIAQANAGVATFSNLTLSSAGTYTLSAADSSYTIATSGSFTVSNPMVGLPAPWQAVSVGAVGVAGSATYSNGTFSVNGSGNDIYGAADAFEGVFQTVSGDHTIIAQITGVPSTGAYAKTGIMIRASTAANSQEASMMLTPSGAFFESRTTPGGSTGYTSASAPVPYWVKLVRAGNTISGYISPNGSTWTLVGSTTISMGTSVQIGLVTTSWDNKLLGTGTFANVSVM